MLYYLIYLDLIAIIVDIILLCSFSMDYHRFQFVPSGMYQGLIILQN